MKSIYAAVIAILAISYAVAYKLPSNTVKKESLCPSHIAGAERLIFNGLMHGVGSKEEFEKTIVNRILKDKNSVKFDNVEAWLDNLKEVWEERNLFPNVVVLIVLIILFALYLCFLNPFCWCCCSCCCMKNYENEVDDEYIKEMERLPKGSDPPPFKTLENRDSSRDDCCSSCCCCCGIKCGFCCVSFAFLCCLVAILFGIFAFANHPLGGYPSRLVGEMNTTESTGALRMLDFADEFTSSALDFVKETILNVVVGDFVMDKVVNTLVSSFTNYISFSNVATNLTAVIDVVSDLVTPDEIDYMINNITAAIDSFISEDEVNEKIANFSESVDDISRSINGTLDSIERCNNNIKSNRLLLSEESHSDNGDIAVDDALLFDNLVNVIHILGKNFTKLLSYKEEWNKWTDVQKCLAPQKTCNDNELDKIADSFELVYYVKKNSNISELETILTTGYDDIIAAFENYITATSLRNLEERVSPEESKFGKLQKKINASDYYSLSENIMKINSSLYDMNTDALVDIIKSINNTLNSIPSFQGIADVLENVMNITNIIPFFNNIIDEFSNLLDHAIDMDNIGDTLDEIRNMTSDAEDMKDNISNITDTIRGFDKVIKESFNSSQYIEVIENIKKTAIESANNVSLGMFTDNITEIADEIFDIFDESLGELKKVYDLVNENAGSAANGKLSDLETFVEKLDDKVYEEFKKCYNTLKPCYDVLKDYFKGFTVPADLTSLSAPFDSLYNAIHPNIVNKDNENSRILKEESEKPISYIRYNAVSNVLPNTISSMNNSMSPLTAVNDQISNGKDQISNIIDPLKSANETMHSVTDNIETFEDLNENTYKKYHVIGRLENLFMNNINPQIETMRKITKVIENAANLIDNFTNIVKDFSSIDFAEWSQAVNSTEDWILNIINYIFPNNAAFREFLNTDDEYKEYKDIVINIDNRNNEEFKDSGYYLAYLLTLGGKLKIDDRINDALSNTTGLIFYENTTNIRCLTSACIKETVNELWNTAKLSIITGNPEDDKDDYAKYIKYGGVGLGVVESVVILIPLFLLLLELMYVGFRLKGHNCCCECCFSLTSCCCNCVLLLFALFGIFGFLPMLLCNMIPDIADVVIQLDSVTQYFNQSSNSVNMTYIESNRTLNVQASASDINIELNLYLEDIVYGYLGGNCDKKPAPLNKTGDEIYNLVQDIYDKEILNKVIEEIDKIKQIKDGIKKPIKNLIKDDVKNTIRDVINSVLAEKGIASCNTVTTMFRPLVDMVCCDFVNDAIALGTASVLIGIFMFISTCCIPCANVCLGEGDLTEYDPPSKEFLKKEKEKRKKEKEEKNKGQESEKEKKKREMEEKKTKKLEKKKTNRSAEESGAFQMRNKKK